MAHSKRERSIIRLPTPIWRPLDRLKFFSALRTLLLMIRAIYTLFREIAGDSMTTPLLRCYTVYKKKKKKNEIVNWCETLNVKKETINKAVNVGMGG